MNQLTDELKYYQKQLEQVEQVTNQNIKIIILLNTRSFLHIYADFRIWKNVKASVIKNI